MKIKISFVTAAAVLLVCSCASYRTASTWNARQMWYEPGKAYDKQDMDVLYIVSTEVLSATGADGGPAWRSHLTAEDMAAMTGELDWVEKNLFSEGFNLAAPYYHQFTFDALSQLDPERFREVYSGVAAEVCKAFDYYMKHENRGRRFVLAGFSQGAMLCLDLLRHMTDSEYSRMVACYCMGYRLSAEDLKHPHIRAAQGSDDTGVVVSFNSTMSREAIWPVMSGGAAACINPVNWHTDATRAEFQFEGTSNTVSVDPETQVLIVETDKPESFHAFYELAPFFLDAGVSRDNLHHWDLLFYARQIHDNALLRAGRAR